MKTKHFALRQSEENKVVTKQNVKFCESGKKIGFNLVLKFVELSVFFATTNRD
jgi:hypothetical protein